MPREPEPGRLITPDVAVVLAGGKSRRMGRDKAAIETDGQSLLARMVALAGTFCPLVVVSGRDPAPYGACAPWFADAWPGLGPLGGVATALTRYGCACLVLGCDLPFLDRETLARLLSAWRGRDEQTLLTAFQQAETGRVETLVAVYQPEAEGPLRRAAGQGRLKLSAAIPKERTCHVLYPQAESLPFFNLNTPADLAVWQSRKSLRL